MTTDREMTLKEWVGRLSAAHLAAREYTALCQERADLLAALREIVDLNPIENNADEGDRCFFCGKDLDYGPGLSLVEAHEEDCPFVMASKAIAKAEGTK